MSQIRSSLITDREIGGKMVQKAPELSGVSQTRLPICGNTSITIPRDQQTLIQQFIDPSGPFTGKYLRVAIVHSDQRAAVGTFNDIRSKVGGCPRKGHIGARKTPKGTVLAYDFTWTSTRDEISGWRHVRGVQENTSSLAGKSNTIALTYDFLLRANTIIATVYWERLEEKESGAEIPKRATALMTRQLHKIR